MARTLKVLVQTTAPRKADASDSLAPDPVLSTFDTETPSISWPNYHSGRNGEGCDIRRHVRNLAPWLAPEP